jgi:hypothetical protein
MIGRTITVPLRGIRARGRHTQRQADWESPTRTMESAGHIGTTISV